MTEQPDNLVLVYLRRLDEKLDRVVDDVQDVKHRMTAVEKTMAGLHGEIAGIRGDYAGLQHRMDRMDARLDRIERRPVCRIRSSSPSCDELLIGRHAENKDLTEAVR